MRVIADRYIPYLRGLLEERAEVDYIDPEDFTPERVKEADALLIRTRTRCDASLLQGSRVRFIATCTIGMDQFDLPWCASHGIATANAPGCNAPGVAQYVWSALLRAGIRPGEHRVGIVGYGNVGRIVAEWGRAMGYEILLNDPPLLESGFDDGKAAGVFTNLNRLLQESDVVTFHTPLIKNGPHPTYHLLDTNKISLLRQGAVIVNAARGPVTDTEALLKAREEKGARLIVDTWENEPMLSHKLLDATMYGTFHIAGYSRQGKERATRMAVEALCRHFALTPPDMVHLAPPYSLRDSVSAEEILRSYNPETDSRLLRENPQAFETMRDHYAFRDEPSFVRY